MAIVIDGFMGIDSSNDSQKTDPFGDSFNSSSSFGNAFQAPSLSKDPFYVDHYVLPTAQIHQKQLFPTINNEMLVTNNKSISPEINGGSVWPNSNIAASANLMNGGFSNEFPSFFANETQNTNCSEDDWPGTNTINKPKPVTTIEEGFDKLVDMNSLVMPTSNPNKGTNPFLSDPSHEARKVKNPFDHIINPPKLSLNDLSAAKISPMNSNGASAFFNNGINGWT